LRMKGWRTKAGYWPLASLIVPDVTSVSRAAVISPMRPSRIQAAASRY
jgi:hypothetical protein